MELNKVQEVKYKELLQEVVADKELSEKLQRYFKTEEIVNYIKEGCKFYSEEISEIKVILTNNMDMYMNIFRTKKDGMTLTFKVHPIESFAKYREDFSNIKVGYTSISELIGQEFSLINPSLIKLDEFVFTNLFTIRKGEDIDRKLYITFYIKERGVI